MGIFSVGATRDICSLTRSKPCQTPGKTIGLCPYPFPYQIWFDGERLQAESIGRQKGSGS
jgi:hypothetical protein